MRQRARAICAPAVGHQHILVGKAHRGARGNDEIRCACRAAAHAFVGIEGDRLHRNADLGGVLRLRVEREVGNHRGDAYHRGQDVIDQAGGFVVIKADRVVAVGLQQRRIAPITPQGTYRRLGTVGAGKRSSTGVGKQTLADLEADRFVRLFIGIPLVAQGRTAAYAHGRRRITAEPDGTLPRRVARRLHRIGLDVHVLGQ